MMWYDIVIPVVTLLVGGVGGFFIGVYFLRKQMENMQNDPAMMQKMAKQMGYNMNRQQMAKAQQMMKQGAFPPQQGKNRKR